MKTFPNDIILMLAIAHLSKHLPLKLTNKFDCTDLLLVLLQISTRVCVLSDYIVFRSACDDYYLEKGSWRRPRRGAGLAPVHRVLPPPVGGAHLYTLYTPSPSVALSVASASQPQEGDYLAATSKGS